MPSRKNNIHKTNIDLARSLSKDLLKKYNQEFIKLARTVLSDYLERVTSKILEGAIYKVPMRLGFITIMQHKAVSPPVDWKNSVKYKRLIVHKNWHSDGYTYRWVWTKRGHYAIFTNSTMYVFKPYKPLKKQLRDKILTEHTDYLLWNSSHSKQLY